MKTEEQHANHNVFLKSNAKIIQNKNPYCLHLQMHNTKKKIKRIFGYFYLWICTGLVENQYIHNIKNIYHI